MVVLILDSKFLDFALDNLEIFVKEVFSGHAEDQKLKMLEKLQNLSKLYKAPHVMKRIANNTDDIESRTHLKKMKLDVVQNVPNESISENNQTSTVLQKCCAEKKTQNLQNDSKTLASKAIVDNVEEIEAMNPEKNLLKSDLTKKLPDEIWLKIIKNLPIKDMLGKFALVSKRFNDLTKDAALFRNFHLNSLSCQNLVHLVPAYRQVLKKSNELMINLTIEHSMFGMGEAIFEVLKSNKSLKSLKIKEKFHCTFPSKFQEFIKQTKIETLDLENIDVKADEIKEISKVKTLKHLKVKLPLSAPCTSPSSNSQCCKPFLDPKSCARGIYFMRFLDNVVNLNCPSLETLCIFASNKIPPNALIEQKLQKIVSTSISPKLKFIQIECHRRWYMNKDE